MSNAKPRVSTVRSERPAKSLRSARSAPLSVALTERMRHALGPVVSINISDARAQMPQMVRASAGGHTYVIGSARSADAPAAVLIGLAELARVVEEAARPLPERTLAELLDSLPFSGMVLQPLQADTLPGTGLPAAQLPA